ncbi:MAG: hypothetical protein HYV07_03780 [Deltaproteobacteria bacterium]|nr:hypothetical protein [Deltaproteobacteria bacterium]
MKRILSLFVLAGCVDDIPGQPPPLDQVHYPVGLALVAGDARLLVVNSNFDLRYGAGSLLSLPVEGSYALAKQSTVESPIDRLPEDTYGVRIPSFGGEVAVIPGPSGAVTAAVPSRGKNLVTFVDVGRDGGLSCSTAGADALAGIDCSAAHVIETRGIDPYAVSLVAGTRALAVGHLRADVGHPALSLFDLDVLASRKAAEAAGQALPSAALTSTTSDLAGVAGLVSFGQAEGELVMAAARFSGGVPVTTYRVSASDEGLAMAPVARLSLGSLTGATELRGLALSADRTRAYVAMRVLESSGGAGPTLFNSAIAVIRIDGAALSLASVIEVGDEIGAPALLERGEQRFVYAPDLRTGSIYVLDARSDALLVASVIRGYRTRPGDGELLHVGWLSTPAAIVFASLPSENKTLAFVSNFANSTLAVIDASSEDPREHVLVGRLGRVMMPDGSTDE